MKKLIKQAAKKTLLGAKKTVTRVPALRKVAVKAKNALFPELAGLHQEVYHFEAYYPTIQEHMHQLATSKEFTYRPLISLLLPTYNTPDDYLRECLDSVLLQSYDNWELCIADDASPDPGVLKTLREYADKDRRIKIVARKKNGHISEATNSALDIATGEYMALLDHDDVLWPNALYEMVGVMQTQPEVDFIYTDEDKIDGSGKVHSYPFLKPDWSPEFLESCNYITHFSCIRTSLIKKIGGFRKGCEGAQDWDLFIRVTEQTDKIVHIPKLLYSWRIHEASTAANTDAKPYVYEAQKKLLTDHLERIHRKGAVETGIITQHRTIKYAIKASDLLSVVVPADDNAEGVKRLVRSLTSVPAGASFEVVCIYQSTPSESLQQELQALAPGVALRHHSGANVYHAALQYSKGNYLAFMQPDMEIISQDWAKILMGDAQLPQIGLVGPVLLDSSRVNIRSAGLGILFGDHDYLNMLEGTPFDDPHYSRGLYAKSRRNVSALNEAAYAVKNTTLQEVIDSGYGAQNGVELALVLLEHGYRNVYTPYVQGVLHGSMKQAPVRPDLLGPDRYLNPNFNHANPRMEVKA